MKLPDRLLITMKQPSVFEKYAHEYDLLTNAAQREKNHAREVEKLINRFHPASVLDAGCATGLTSMIFARQGIKTVGLDRSRKMLEQARKKYGSVDYPLTFRFGQFEKLPRNLHGSFDLIVCLANAIAGVRTRSALNTSMKGFFNLLQPGGHLVLQLLNYKALKEGEVMPIRATSNDGIVYIRYSIRQGSRLAMHVVRMNMNDSPISFEPFVTEFDNFDVDVVLRAVKKVGFIQTRQFGNLLLDKRFSKSTRDLVIVAGRPR